MTSKNRDYVAEIEAIRNRKMSGVNQELTARLFALQMAFEERGGMQPEVMRYFPVALVACLEGYSRSAVARLIDAGDPYLSNSEKLNVVKLDFSILKAVHGRSITVGELIAHGVSISRLEHIDAHLTILLGNGFLDGMRRVCDLWEAHCTGAAPTPALIDPDRVFAGVKRTFELRHIICHETASAYEITVAEIEDCYKSCVVFLNAMMELIFQILIPNAPLTQQAMNERASQSLAKQETSMRALIDVLRGKLSAEGRQVFDQTQARWDDFAASWAYFVVGPSESGGTIWPMLHSETMEDMVKRRIEILGAWDAEHSLWTDAA